MSRALRIGVLLCLALVVLPVLAAPARARGEAGAMQFGLPPSHGYKIGVKAHGATVYLSVVRPEHGGHAGAATTYLARAKLGAGRIQARLGDLGSVSMRFKPSGRVLHGKPQRGCTGPDRTTAQLGVFVGSLRFRGEGGYLAVRAHRAMGKLIDPPSPDCAGSATPAPKAGHASKRAKLTSLSAGYRLGLGAVYFDAVTDRTRRAHYSVTAEQSEGRLAKYHYATTGARPFSFATDAALSFATLTPPAPFSGTGLLRRNPDGSRIWSGSLAVSFPGDPDVPLTGSQFKTQLTRSW